MKGPVKYKFPNSKIAAQSLSKGELSTSYLFLGEELGEKERFISIISDLYFGKKTPPEQRLLSTFFAQNGEVPAAAGFTLSSSMFDPKKICVLNDIEKITIKGEQILVADMVRDIPDSTLLVLISGENNPPKYLSEETIGQLQPVVFWRMFENELQTHITQAFKEKGRIIEAAAARRIVSLTGRDLKKVNAAIDRVLIGTEENPVSEQTVISLIADEKEISIFELTDAILKRRKDSFRLLRKVLDEGSADLQILAILEREAKRIELYHDLKGKGLSHDDAIGELHINPKGMDDFLAYLRVFPEPAIREFMVLLSKADYAAKSSSYSSSILSGSIAGLIASTLA